MPTTNLQRVPRPSNEWAMPRGEFASPTVARGYSNWGAGVQPTRGLPTVATRAPRNLGTLTSADLNRGPTGFPLGQRPVPTGAPLASAVSTVVTPAYRPPQQTERANPLTGDNNIPIEGTSTPVPAPFIQRGAAIPQGQDVTIGGSMQGTFDRLRGNIGGAGQFARRFGSPQAASAYDRYARALFT